MRTLATTFTTRDEAESAIRRLEALGLSRERISVKDMAQAGAGGTGGVFVSVKVTTEQVQPVGEILKSAAPRESADLPPRAEPVAAPAPPIVEPAPPARGSATHFGAPEIPAVAVKAAAIPPSPPQSREAPLTGAAAEAARARRARTYILFGLALIGAFMIGAWLGLLT